MFPTVELKPPNKRRCHPCLLRLAILRFFLPPWVQRMLGEAQAASRQELEQRPWLCWRLQGARLEIKPNKNVWFVAFIFGRCQLQFELARCLEAGCVTNMKDALMNCWQSSVSSLIHYMMAMKSSAHCFTGGSATANGIRFYTSSISFKKKAIWFIQASFVTLVKHQLFIHVSAQIFLLILKKYDAYPPKNAPCQKDSSGF